MVPLFVNFHYLLIRFQKFILINIENVLTFISINIIFNLTARKVLFLFYVKDYPSSIIFEKSPSND
jgi:hypothetical protein